MNDQLKDRVKMTLLLHLDQHIELVNHHLEKYQGFKVDDEIIYIGEEPNYILEREEDSYFFYPIEMNQHKDLFSSWYCKYCNADDIMKDIRHDEKVEILKINGKV